MISDSWLELGLSRYSWLSIQDRSG